MNGTIIKAWSRHYARSKGMASRNTVSATSFINCLIWFLQKISWWAPLSCLCKEIKKEVGYWSSHASLLAKAVSLKNCFVTVFQALHDRFYIQNRSPEISLLWWKLCPLFWVAIRPPVSCCLLEEAHYRIYRPKSNMVEFPFLSLTD